MKKQKVISTILLSLLMMFIIGCSDSGNSTSALQQNERDKVLKVDKQNTLVSTRWKLKAFVDISTNETTIVESSSGYDVDYNDTNDRIFYYLKREGTFFVLFDNNCELIATSSRNPCQGIYKLDEEKSIISVENFGLQTYVGETKDGYDFTDVLGKKINNSKYIIDSNSLKIYYDNETKYLLFNKLTPKIEKN